MIIAALVKPSQSESTITKVLPCFEIVEINAAAAYLSLF